jgi:hypothetical protein
MTTEQLMELLIVAANAQTDEEKARICWRASDYMWRKLWNFGFSREFNNLLQDQNWPWVENLWSEAEIAAIRREYITEVKE